MRKKKNNFITTHLELCLIVIALTGFGLVIHPVLGVIIGALAFVFYRRNHSKFLPQEKTPEEVPVYEDTKKLIDTLVSEQAYVEKIPLDSVSYPIKKGSLPVHVHETLDEMKITTWAQLALCDEKELLYQKCFGEKALKKIKTELGKRGLALNGQIIRENDRNVSGKCILRGSLKS